MPKTKHQKRAEAAERQAEYNKLSLNQKIDLARLRGGKKELARLMKRKEAL